MRDLFEDSNSGVMGIVIYVFVTSRGKVLFILSNPFFKYFLSHCCYYQLISKLVMRNGQKNIQGKHFLVNV